MVTSEQDLRQVRVWMEGKDQSELDARLFYAGYGVPKDDSTRKGTKIASGESERTLLAK
jgi:hypothetical protein